MAVWAKSGNGEWTGVSSGRTLGRHNRRASSYRFRCCGEDRLIAHACGYLLPACGPSTGLTVRHEQQPARGSLISGSQSLGDQGLDR